MMYVAKFENISKDDIGIAGGKGANLGELTQAGIPVPPGFVVTAETYQKFMESAGIYQKVMDILGRTDINDTKELQLAADEIKDMIINAPIPADISTLIIEAYNILSQDVGAEYADVAIRSSATAEDLPDASFAGQQDTFLHVKGADEVLEYVKKCWASLFEARAIFYREENDFDHSKVLIAVVVQQMVDADKAGVMFTVNPSTGENIALIEGSWGLGESVVSGTVTPDNYVVNKEDNKILDVKINDKKTMFANDAEGTSKEVPVPEEKRKERVLSDEELVNLTEMGKRVQSHYREPMDTEWAMENGELYLLQARPITTLDGDEPVEEDDEETDLNVIIRGLGASPGIASGLVTVIMDVDELDKVGDGDVMVTTMTTPDMVPAMKRASGIVTDEGGVTCHAAIISRELGIPCVVGTGNGTSTLKENTEVTADGKKGLVYEGIIKQSAEADEDEKPQVANAAPILTVTEVKANVSMAEAAPKAFEAGADGVGLLRTEHMMLATGIHPGKFIDEGKEDELVDILVENILKVADVFYPKPVWYRTLDSPTDEFKTLKGGENEPDEPNPMLGWRGIRRELDQEGILRAEFKAIKKLHDQGYTNIGVMIPLANHPDELRKAKEICESVGLVPHKDIDFGMMVEIPAAAVLIEDFIDVGLDFVSLGTNDLTQYTLAVDRNNEFVAKNYNEQHPAVMKLVERTIKACVENGVKCSICGQAGSKPEVVEKLVEMGITSVSANTDAIPDVRRTVAIAEQKLILNAARDMKK